MNGQLLTCSALPECCMACIGPSPQPIIQIVIHGSSWVYGVPLQAHHMMNISMLDGQDRSLLFGTQLHSQHSRQL